MISPSSGVVTQGFSGSHPAVDYAYNGGGTASYGQPIVAPEAGRVTYVGQMGTGVNDAGTVVQIVAGPRTHRLCHLIPTSLTVRADQQVSQGQQVGQMGYSGYVIPAGMQGSHLHWVMEINGRRVDGRQYINEEEDMARIEQLEASEQRLAQEVVARDKRIEQLVARVTQLETSEQTLAKEVVARDKRIAALESQPQGDYVKVDGLYVKK